MMGEVYSPGKIIPKNERFRRIEIY